MSGPAIRVVRGGPTPEELAALVVVLSAVATGPVEPAAPPSARDTWASPARAMSVSPWGRPAARSTWLDHRHR